MSKAKILVVEDDVDISNMLRIYFSGQGYEVQVAPKDTRFRLHHVVEMRWLIRAGSCHT